MPKGLIYTGGLEVNGSPFTGDITKGINIDMISPGYPKTITFYALVDEAEKFAFGQNTIVNAATAQKDGLTSHTDTATVIVSKAEVAGIATNISTGLTNNLFLDTFFLPLLIVLAVLWLLKSHIIKYEEWLDARIKQYKGYKSEKSLQFEISKIKAREFFFRR
jgi:hypothetical protein